MRRQLLLDTLVDTILQNHSFEFQTFAEAKQTILMDNGSIQYTYDRLSLNVYGHTLAEAECSYVERKLRADYYMHFSREDQKQTEEYGVLLAFLSLKNVFSEYSIQKKVRPDFVLSGSRYVGVEITKLTTQTDSVITAICNQNFGKRLSAREIENYAIRKHGKKARSYHYHEVKGIAAVSAGLQDIGHNKEIYADEIISKYEKYNKEFADYDNFIILCDARMVIGITSEWDAEDVVDRARRKSALSNCIVCILYCDNLCAIQLKTVEL